MASDGTATIGPGMTRLPRAGARLFRHEPVAAWAALGACALTLMLFVGTRASFAAFLRPIERDLGLDRATVSAAAALTLLVNGLLQPLVGALATRHGARPVMMGGVALLTATTLGVAAANQAWQLLLFAGLLPGVAAAAAGNTPAAALLAAWFDRRLGLATGVMSSAIPAGQALFVPLAATLIPLVGWRTTYVLLGLGLSAVALPILWAFAREPRDIAVPEARVGPGRASGRRRVGADVWLVGAGFFACGFTDQFVALHLVALATDGGLEPVAAAAYLSLLLLVGLGGSIISGRLADVARPHTLLGLLYLLRAFALPLLLLIGTALGPVALGGFALLFGMTYIANEAPGTRLVRDRYGPEAVGVLKGRVGLGHQFGGAAGIAVGGFSVALSGGYGPAIALATGVALAGAALQACIPVAQRRQAATA